MLHLANRLLRCRSTADRACSCRPARLIGSVRRRLSDPPHSYDIQLDFPAPAKTASVSAAATARGNRMRWLAADAELKNLPDSARLRLESLRLQIEVQIGLAAGDAGSSCLPDCASISSRQWLDLLSCADSQSLDRQLYKIYRLQWNMQNDEFLKAQVSDSALPLLTKMDVTHFYQARLHRELEFSDTVVIDFAYDAEMSPAAVASLCQDMRGVVRRNRESRQPFGLQLCGPNLRHTRQLAALFRVFRPDGFVDEESYAKDELDILRDSLPYDIVDACFTSCAVNDGLASVVYIVPNVERQLQSYDPRRLHVLAGYPHRVLRLKRAALARAKSLGVEYCSLPTSLSGATQPTLCDSFRALLALKNRHFFHD